LAEENKCDNCYEDYEFENKTQFQRRHCIIYVDFAQDRVNNMVEFLNHVKKNQDIHVELVYDDNNHQILYASQYFITQKMDKYAANEFRMFKRKRSYSDDETMILKAISK
jgi:hypothetical protein